ncbi:MAG TPA: VOC family protein [Gammaproteobacteria bacterium]|nr:VOC family protein [Gammaproteobacteria bacterium]
MDMSGNILDTQLVRFSTMIVVTDIDSSEEFYTNYFGLEKVQHLDHLRLLQRAGMSLYLATESPPTEDKPTVTLAPPRASDRTPVNLIFHVKNVRATYSALKEKGLEFLAPPNQPPWGGWRVFTRDPDGYLIEIEQPA